MSKRCLELGWGVVGSFVMHARWARGSFAFGRGSVPPHAGAFAVRASTARRGSTWHAGRTDDGMHSLKGLITVLGRQRPQPQHTIKPRNTGAVASTRTCVSTKMGRSHKRPERDAQHRAGARSIAVVGGAFERARSPPRTAQATTRFLSRGLPTPALRRAFRASTPSLDR